MAKASNEAVINIGAVQLETIYLSAGTLCSVAHNVIVEVNFTHRGADA